MLPRRADAAPERPNAAGDSTDWHQVQRLPHKGLGVKAPRQVLHQVLHLPHQARQSFQTPDTPRDPTERQKVTALAIRSSRQGGISKEAPSAAPAMQSKVDTDKLTKPN